jgi:hypothetical protein
LKVLFYKGYGYRFQCLQPYQRSNRIDRTAV